MIPQAPPSRWLPPMVVIAARNEAATIAETVERVRAAVPGSCVVVIDDDSQDGTLNQAAMSPALVVPNRPRGQYGTVFARGVALAAGMAPRAVVFLDAGLSYQPEDVPALLAKLVDSGADVVIGSRYIRGAAYRGPWRRRLVSWGLVKVLLPLFSLSRPLDYSGFRAFSPWGIRALAREDLRGLWSMKAHAFNPQLLQLMRSRGFRIAQVPVVYTCSKSDRHLASYFATLLGLVNVARMRLTK